MNNLSGRFRWLRWAAILVFCSQTAALGEPDSTRVEERREMINTQIVSRGVTSPTVLAAMEKVKRHLFVPPEYRQQAYDDYPLPIGEGQTVSQPYIVALMTDLLELDGDETVLEIGTGSGYQAAVLGELAEKVFSIEIIGKLGERAAELLEELDYSNISVVIGDGYRGLEEQAPFDGIIVTCAPPEVPAPLLDQLAEGGRMVIPVGQQYQELLLIEKVDGECVERRIIPVRFVPMTGEAAGDN